MSLARNWCFTINNYSDDDQALLRELVPRGLALYLVFGRETGASGTKHLQGYIQLSTKKRIKWLKNTIHATAHFESARGTPQENTTYCTKDGDAEEIGVRQPGQGARTDLQAVVDMVRAGATIRKIAEEHPQAAIRYGHGIARLRIVLPPPSREEPPIINVFWGATGLGKTRRVHSECDPGSLWIHPGGPWFDGYDSHEAVLFDDFDGGWFKLGYLLKLLDRYTFQVPMKGGYLWWNPPKIYITSNIDPRLWYQGASSAQVDALMRRLTQFGTVHHFANPYGV